MIELNPFGEGRVNGVGEVVCCREAVNGEAGESKSRTPSEFWTLSVLIYVAGSRPAWWTTGDTGRGTGGGWL